jgi:hypothetical protein
MSHGTLHIPSYSALRVKKTDELSFGMQGVSLPLPVIWGRLTPLSTESRYIQQIPLKYSPVQITYAPDGQSLLYVSGGNQLFFLTYVAVDEDTKKDGKPVKEWRTSDQDIVRPGWSSLRVCFIFVKLNESLNFRIHCNFQPRR